MNIVGWIVDRVRTMGARFSYTASRAFGVMYYGTVVSMTYLNYKHDPTPNILVMYSGMRYTHGINLNYLSNDDKQWIGRILFMIKKGGQVIDGRTLYLMIKTQRPSIVRSAYRIYHTKYISNPRMVSAGFTVLGKLEHPSSDPYIQALNRYLSPASHRAYSVRVSYSDTELQERIILAQQSTPLVSATESATRPLGSATRQM